MQKTVEQRAKDVAKWKAKTEEGLDDDSLDTTPKPHKVSSGDTGCLTKMRDDL